MRNFAWSRFPKFIDRFLAYTHCGEYLLLPNIAEIQGRQNWGAWRWHSPRDLERWETGAQVPLHNNITCNFRDAGERWNDRVIFPLPFQKGATWTEVPFHNRIIGNFMVCKDRLETSLLQLFAHPQNSEWSSIISAIMFEVNVVATQKEI